MLNVMQKKKTQIRLKLKLEQKIKSCNVSQQSK